MPPEHIGNLSANILHLKERVRVQKMFPTPCTAVVGIAIRVPYGQKRECIRFPTFKRCVFQVSLIRLVFWPDEHPFCCGEKCRDGESIAHASILLCFKKHPGYCGV